MMDCNQRHNPMRQRGKNKHRYMNSDEIIIPIFGIMLPIIITLGAFIMIVYLRKFENIERMSIIEKGLSPDIFKKDQQRYSSSALRGALLMIGVGIGFLMGYWLDRTFNMEETGYFSMLFIFGGLGLVLSYVLEESKNKKG